MIALLLRYWQIGLAVAAVAFGAVMWHEHNVAEVEKGVAQERYRVADATVKAIRSQLVHTDTLVVRDTVKVRVAVDRVVTLRDTVLSHLTDTVLVKQFVTRADSAAKACVELSNDCQAFRAYATQTIKALEQKVTTAPVAKPPHHLAADVLWFTLGAAGGYFAHR